MNTAAMETKKMISTVMTSIQNVAVVVMAIGWKRKSVRPYDGNVCGH